MCGLCSCEAVQLWKLSYAPPTMRDIHSFARPEEAIVRHLALDLDVDFAQRRLAGSATLMIETENGARELVLDTHGLTIDH